eukprot:COSAG01_NODE_4929_length_4614_cov_15.381395_3_plen_188_part_00
MQREAPAPLTDSQRQALQAERNHRRGYTADDQLEASVRKMTQGRPSQSLAILMSHGVNPDAFDALLDLHFEPPAVDPHALSDTEHMRYHYLRQQAPTPAFEAALRAELEKRLPKLRRGVGPGPSGERYEYLAAAAMTPGGLQAVVDLGLRLLHGPWSDAMREQGAATERAPPTTGFPTVFPGSSILQ